MNLIDFKIKETIKILQNLGLPSKQQNERSARTLLALLGLKAKDECKNAKSNLLRIHDILEFIAKEYKFRYAENSRETIRRQTIHQFEQAGIVEKNPDDPSRPTNSGKTVYAVTDIALKTIRNYGQNDWQKSVNEFISAAGSLDAKYKKERRLRKVPLTVKNEIFYLSPGKHNQLQSKVINDFAPLFAHNAEILYLGDTAKKIIIYNKKVLTELGILITKHNKLPDIVLYRKDKNWIYLIEVVTTHGPMSAKRFAELALMLNKCKASPIYVSAFPDMKTFNKYIFDIAWETEVWIADFPSHLIHFNGENFLGPRKK